MNRAQGSLKAVQHVRDGRVVASRLSTVLETWYQDFLASQCRSHAAGKTKNLHKQLFILTYASEPSFACFKSGGNSRCFVCEEGRCYHQKKITNTFNLELTFAKGRSRRAHGEEAITKVQRESEIINLRREAYAMPFYKS